MKTIILHHIVKDYKEWKKHYEADAPRRTNAGLKEIAVGTQTGDEQQVYIIWQSKNPAALEKMINDPDLKAVMKKAGVLGEPEVILLN